MGEANISGTDHSFTSAGSSIERAQRDAPITSKAGDSSDGSSSGLGKAILGYCEKENMSDAKPRV